MKWRGPRRPLVDLSEKAQRILAQAGEHLGENPQEIRIETINGRRIKISEDGIEEERPGCLSLFWGRRR